MADRPGIVANVITFDEPLSEIDVLVAVLALRGEAFVEPAQLLEHSSPHRQMAGENVEMGERPGTLPCLASRDRLREEAWPRPGLDRKIAKDRVGSLCVRVGMLLEKV